MEITVQQLKSKIDAGETFTLLDVRTPAELAMVKLPDSLDIPLNEVQSKVGEMAHLKDTPIVCMCHHGMRSAMAQSILLENGFTGVVNLIGGIHAYAVEVDDSLAVYE